MIYPKFLEKGDCIGVPAPSSGAYDDIHIIRYKNSEKKLNKLGYNVKLSKNINTSIKCRSASAKERAEEINNMFSNKDINFIICAAGGEFLVEILPYVNFENIKNNTKFIEGFSDPTGLLFPITTKYDIATIYGVNFGDYGFEINDRVFEENYDIIQGNMIVQNNYDLYEENRIESVTGFELPNYTEKVYWSNFNRENINVTGRIIGGCLDIIVELLGTKYDGFENFKNKYKNDGIIWYFDNCELSMEELIRSLWKLNEFKYFEYTKCIIFGRNGVEKSCLDYDMKEALKDSVINDLDIPIIYDVDISHKAPCMTIINGSIATVNSKEGKGNIKFELK